MKGRIIYYDTRDGEMLLDTKYIEDHKNSSEKYYLELEAQYGSRDYIAHKFLDYMQFDSEFNEYSNVRVTPDGELFFSMKETKYRIGLKHTMTDRWHPLFEQTSGIYDKETNTINADTLMYYYNDFIFNLKSICKVVPVHWLYPTQLERFNPSNEKALVRWDQHIFKSKDEFAQEILSDGCVFPFQIKKYESRNIILDGSHRVIAMKMLMEQGLWDKKVLTLEFNDTDINYIDDENINYRIEPIEMHMPKLLMDKYHFLEYKHIRRFDDNILVVTIDRYLDMVTLFRMYVFELTIPIKRYKELTGLTLATGLMQDENKYNEWIGE